MCLVAQSCPALCNPMDCSPPGSSVHGDSPDKNTGVSCQALLQGILPTQGLNLGLSHCRWILLPSDPQGKPKNTGVGSLSLLKGIFQTGILKWAAMLSCRGSSQPRDRTQVDSLPAEPPGKPKNTRILEWVAYPFSRGSSQPRNRTRVSCIAGRFFTS